MRKSLRRDIIFGTVLVLILAVVGLAIGFGVDWGADNIHQQGGAEIHTPSETPGKEDGDNTTPSEPSAITVRISIDCRNLMKEENWSRLSKNYRDYLASYKDSEGKVLAPQAYTIPAGTSVLELLRIVESSGIEVNETSGYVTSIAAIPEKVCGGKGGWAYAVNDTLPWNTSSEDYILKDGDSVEWRYTVVMGDVEYA